MVLGEGNKNLNPKKISIKSNVSNHWNFPKVVKSSLAIGMILYLGFLFGSMVIANLFGPFRYNIINHTISQLGSYKFTPLSSMFDLSYVIGGLTTVLFNCYLHRKLQLSSPQGNRNLLLFYKLTWYGSSLGVVGSIGILFVGIFSLERKGSLGILHGFISLIAFGVFAVSLLSFSIIIIKYNTKIPKILALNGLVPMGVLILYFILILPFLEWLLALSVIDSLFPLFCWLIFQ